MSPRCTASFQAARTSAAVFAFSNRLIETRCRRSSALCSSFAPSWRWPAITTPLAVQIVLRGGCRFLASKLDQDMAQLGRRQAGRDDRTVQVGGEVSNFPPSRRRGGDGLPRLSRDLPLVEVPQEVIAAQGIELWDERRRSAQQGRCTWFATILFRQKGGGASRKCWPASSGCFSELSLGSSLGGSNDVGQDGWPGKGICGEYRRGSPDCFAPPCC